jgi:hypothetical protein
MADRYPLVANPDTKQIQELASFDNLNLMNSGIVGATTVTANQFIGDLVGAATTANFLSNASNIISGTINPARLSGTYNIGVTTSLFLQNAANVLSGVLPRQRLDGEYDINITGTASTANSLSDGSQILNGVIPVDRLTGVYNIDITGTAFNAVGAATSVAIGNTTPSPTDKHYILYSEYTNRDASVYTDSNSLVYIPSTNRLGINSDNPSYNLDVNGYAGIATAIINTANITNLSSLVGIDTISRDTLSDALGFNVGLTTFLNLDVDQQTTLNDLIVTGIATIGNLTISSLDSSLNSSQVNSVNLNVSGIATFKSVSIGSTEIINSERFLVNLAGIDTSTKNKLIESLNVGFFQDLTLSGVGTLSGNVLITNGVNVEGETVLEDLTVTGVTSFTTLNANTLTALEYIGDGSTLSGIVTSVFAGIGVSVSPANGKGSLTISAFRPIGKTIFVSQTGNDANTGLAENDTKRTIKAAAEIAVFGDTIKVFPGIYVENNPIILGKGVAVEGAELRNCIVSPQNPGLDLFHVNNSVHITDLSFQGQESQNGAAVVAFQPLSGVASDRFFDAARMIRLNLDYIAKETVGYLTSTDYNGGSFSMGIGTAQNCAEDIKSIFKAVCHDITRGGNSKCVGAGKSYYTVGGALQHIVGVKTETIDAIRYAAGIARAVINNSTWGGKAVGIQTNVTAAVYNNVVGVVTITAANHGLSTDSPVRLSGLGFTCPSGPGTLFYPSGNLGNIFSVKRVINSNQFEVIVGQSTLPHTYVSGGTVQKHSNYQNTFTQVKDLSMQADPVTGFNNGLNGCANVVSAIYSCVGVVTTIINQGLSVLGAGINTTFPGNAGAGTTIPNHPSFSPGVGPITQGPYVRNCTNFIPKSIGMKVDGFAAEPGDQDDIGVTGSMSVDSYTQYNQGGIGVSVTNGAYAQLVSIFTICDDIAIYTASGGQLDLTNSNSSFGTYGLVAEGVGDQTTKSIYRYTGVAVTNASRGQNQVVISGVGTNRPYDGQAIYFDKLYKIVDTISVTNGGSGYTVAPRVTIDNPTGPNGITAQATATVVNGSVTEIVLVTNGTQYDTVPNITISAPPGAGTTATAAVTKMQPIYYTVLEATLPSAGVSTISLAQNLNNTVSAGSTTYFSRVSLQLTSSHAFEFIGAGNTIEGARPAQGGITIQENEVVQNDGGLVVYTSTDQAGNFRIGDGVVINQTTGSITGRDFTKALFTTITPFILALTE